MTLQLTQQHAQAIREHGGRTFPYECCGFLLGKVEGETRRVLATMPAVNERGEEEQHNRFTITPYASFQAEKEARRRKLDIVGFYHSHPDAPARPSDYDLEHATWPHYSYLIVSVQGGRPDEMTSWVLADDRSAFNQETVEIAQTQETP